MKKIIQLKKNLVTNLIFSGVLFALFAGAIFFNFYQKKSAQKQIEQIKAQTEQIRNESSDFESKATEAKKYRDLWEKISDNKKMPIGIKMDEANALIDNLSSKHTIIKPTFKVAMPEAVKGSIFEQPSRSVVMTTANLTFGAVNDSKALLFIYDLINSLPGYVVITNFEIKKTKSYEEKDLVDISTGNGSGAIEGKIDFYWYVYKEKASAKKEKASSSEDNSAKKDEQKSSQENAPNQTTQPSDDKKPAL